MFGQINKITTVPGKRAEVVRLVKSGSNSMPGCHSYIVAKDAQDADVIWVSEVWDSAEMQKASMDIPNIKESVEEAMAMIAGFETIATTIPA